MQKQHYRQFITIIIALAVPIIPFAIIGEMPGEQWLSSSGTSAWLFALTGGALLTLDIALPLPSSIIGSLIAARLGLLPGFLTILIGLTAGHTLGYFVARYTLGRFRTAMPEIPTLLVVFLSRPVPILAEATALTAGASSMPFLHFFGVCVAGNVIYAGVLAGNGAMLLPDALLGPGIFIPMLLPVIAWGIWRLTEKRRRATSELDSL